MMVAAGSGKVDVALVLAGGVAKGAFEAGALQVLAQSPVRIRRIVASSSGALNATILAAAIRQGDARPGADRLAELWAQRASWLSIFDFSPGDVRAGRALSSQERVAELLREQTAGLLTTGKDPIALRYLVAPLEGTVGNLGDRQATTFEAVLAFEGEDFDDPVRREALFVATLASSSFPFLFPPRELELDGRTVHGIDGGVVNNTPVKLAVRDNSVDDSGLSTVVVVAPYPERLVETPPLTGIGLASQIVEMLIGERLYRDLREAEDVNRRVRAVQALTARGFTEEQVAMVRDGVLERRRELALIPIRPKTILAGTAFSAFFDGGLREQYLQAGREAAEQALADHGLA